MAKSQACDVPKATSPSKLVQSVVNDNWKQWQNQGNMTPQQAIQRRHTKSPVKVGRGK